MTAKEYYNNQDRFEYFTKLTNTGISDDFDEIMAFAEAYHEHKLKLLGIPDVVGRSEQLVCPNCDGEGFSGKGTNEILPCLSCFGSGERVD